MAMITDIEDYFTKGCGRCDRFDTPDCSARSWATGLASLRRICLATGLTETVKWAHPCYVAHGRNIAVIGAFRADFRLSFFNAALMRDPDGLLERQGPNTQNPDCIRFTEAGQVTGRETSLRSYLAEAIGYAEQGITAPRSETELVLPDELVEALDTDPELAEAFHRLTPGRQKSYVINLAGAKAAQTRINRIARFRGKILDGKGATER